MKTKHLLLGILTSMMIKQAHAQISCASFQVTSFTDSTGFSITMDGDSTDWVFYPYIEYVLDENDSLVAIGSLGSFAQMGGTTLNYQANGIDTLTSGFIGTIYFSYDGIPGCALSFPAPTPTPTSCLSFQVTNIIQDTTTLELTVSIAMDHDSGWVNYPYIESVVNNIGDTIATGDFWFFAHVPGTIQDYPVVSGTDILSPGFDGTVYFVYDSVECALPFSLPSSPQASISCSSFHVTGFTDSTGFSIAMDGDSTDWVSYPYVEYVLDENDSLVAIGSLASFAQTGGTTQNYQANGIDTLSSGFIGTIYFSYDGLPSCALSFTGMATTVEQEKTAPMLDVYPNPSLGLIFINPISNKKPQEMRVFNIQGEQVLYFNQVPKQIDLSQEPKGMYFLQMEEEGARETKKIVIQ